VKGEEGVVYVYLMCGNTVARAVKGQVRLETLEFSFAYDRSEQSRGELVGRLGQRGCAAQTSSRGPGQAPSHVVG